MAAERAGRASGRNGGSRSSIIRSYSSGGRHGSDTTLREQLESLFLKYGVNVVLSGHDHFYERLKPQKGILDFVVGGSAKLRKEISRARA